MTNDAPIISYSTNFNFTANAGLYSNGLNVNPNITLIGTNKVFMVNIDLTTGRVTYRGLTPDKGSMLFWDSVVTSFPQVKAKLLEEQKKQTIKKK